MYIFFGRKFPADKQKNVKVFMVYCFLCVEGNLLNTVHTTQDLVLQLHLDVGVTNPS